MALLIFSESQNILAATTSIISLLFYNIIIINAYFKKHIIKQPEFHDRKEDSKLLYSFSLSILIPKIIDWTAFPITVKFGLRI